MIPMNRIDEWLDELNMDTQTQVEMHGYADTSQGPWISFS